MKEKITNKNKRNTANSFDGLPTVSAQDTKAPLILDAVQSPWRKTIFGVTFVRPGWG